MQTDPRTSRIGHHLTLFAVIITVLLGVVSSFTTLTKQAVFVMLNVLKPPVLLP